MAHKPKELKGIVEADETFFRESFKGKGWHDSFSPQAWHTGIEERSVCAEQIPFFVCRDRFGCTSDYILEKYQHISSALKPVLASDCILCSDSSKAMGVAGRKSALHIAL